VEASGWNDGVVLDLFNVFKLSDYQLQSNSDYKKFSTRIYFRMHVDAIICLEGMKNSRTGFYRIVKGLVTVKDIVEILSQLSE